MRTHTERRPRRARISMAVLLAIALVAVGQLGADAALQLVRPDAAVPATFVGRGGYSADGLGQLTGGGTIQAEVPAGSTVEQAYLYGSYNQTVPAAAALQIDFDGTVSNLAILASIEPLAGFFLTSARADVTAQVAAKVGSGGGTTNFAVNSDPVGLDGVGLVVIYSNPALPELTIALLDGAQATSGDTVTFNFAEPLDTTLPGFVAQMSLGIGFGFQGDGYVHECGANIPQFSYVDINATRLSSCAGNYDDGAQANDALLTVGGVGDSLDNPSDPLAEAGTTAAAGVADDELYDLRSFVSQGDTQLTVSTKNPSNDDLVFLSVIAISARASVTTEVCDDGIDNDGDTLVDADDPDCQETPPPSSPGFMTGGGTLKGNAKVSHGFRLECDATTGSPSDLQVNWGKGNRFHLEGISAVACSDGPGISEGNPAAGFDTIRGSGTGRYNGASGATVEWVLTDAGEPGKQDSAAIRITDAGGNVVLNTTGTLSGGNHQAHPAG